MARSEPPAGFELRRCEGAREEQARKAHPPRKCGNTEHFASPSRSLRTEDRRSLPVTQPGRRLTLNGSFLRDNLGQDISAKVQFLAPDHL
jgi:hypothetical protein